MCEAVAWTMEKPMPRFAPVTRITCGVEIQGLEKAREEDCRLLETTENFLYFLGS